MADPRWTPGEVHNFAWWLGTHADKLGWRVAVVSQVDEYVAAPELLVLQIAFVSKTRHNHGSLFARYDALVAELKKHGLKRQDSKGDVSQQAWTYCALNNAPSGPPSPCDAQTRALTFYFAEPLL